MNILDIIKKLHYPQECFRAQMINEGIEFARNIIMKNIVFQQEESKVQAQLLSGYKQSFKMGRINILEEEKESAIYNILSNSVHGLYIGLGSSSLNHSLIYNNHIGAIMLLMLSCEITIIYTANVIKDYLDLRKKLYKYLSNEEKKSLNEMKSLDMLNKYLEYKKKEFGESFFD